MELDDVLQLEPALYINPEEFHSKVSSLGPATLHSEFANFFFGHCNQIVAAYENLLTVSMKIK